MATMPKAIGTSIGIWRCFNARHEATQYSRALIVITGIERIRLRIPNNCRNAGPLKESSPR